MQPIGSSFGRPLVAGLVGGAIAVGVLAAIAAVLMPRLMPRMMMRMMSGGCCSERMRECMEHCGCGAGGGEPT